MSAIRHSLATLEVHRTNYEKYPKVFRKFSVQDLSKLKRVIKNSFFSADSEKMKAAQFHFGICQGVEIFWSLFLKLLALWCLALSGLRTRYVSYTHCAGS